MFRFVRSTVGDCRIRFGVVMLPVLIVLGSSIARGDESTAKYFDGLRQRRMFRLAEAVCARHMAQERVSPELRAQLTLELSRTFAEHAKYTIGAEQADLWKRARDAINDRIQKDAELPPRHVYRLRMQFAIVNVLESEFLLWQKRLLPHDATLAKRAVEKLSGTVTQLQSLRRDFDKAYRRARSRRRRSSEQDAIATELKSLLEHLDYQLAIALVNQAEALPAASRGRKTAITEAESMLRDLAGGNSASPIAWNSRVLLVTAARLSDRGELVAKRLKAIERMKPPLAIVDRTMAERVKMFLQLNQPVQADNSLTKYYRARGGFPGELSYLRVKTDLALWAVARKNKKSAAEALFRKEAAANTTLAERNLGGYWGYRCRVLLANSQDDQTFGGPLAAAIRKARSFHQHQKLTEAATEYASAISIADKSGNRDVAGDLRFTLGSILLQSKRYEAAAEAFREISEKTATHPRAADAHLMWAYCLGRSYDADRTKTRRLTYTQALEEHRKRFAGTATAAEAAWMLALLEEHRLQLTVALKYYLEIPADHNRGKAAQVAAARCLEGILGRLRELKRPKDLKAWEEYAVEQLGGIARGFPKAPMPLDLSQAEVAMRLSRIQLNRGNSDYRQADALLERVFESAPRRGKTKPSKAAVQQGKEWTSLVQIARQLRIVSLAGRGQIDRAREAMKQLSDVDSPGVLAILDGLMQLAPASDAKMRRDLGLLQLHAAVELNRKRSSLTATEQAWLDRCLAQAYASSGQTRSAIEHNEKLLAKSPRNRALRKTTAELLLKSKDRAHLTKAKTYWRQIEASEKKGSHDWLNARYQTALCEYRLREFAECRKLLNVTKLLYPELGGGELQRRYLALIAKLGMRSPAD